MITVFFVTKSCTRTTPRFTTVSVPSQRSCTSQIVPDTVAELYRPRVRYLPLPLPQRLGFGGFFVAASVRKPWSFFVFVQELKSPRRRSSTMNCGFCFFPFGEGSRTRTGTKELAFPAVG